MPAKRAILRVAVAIALVALGMVSCTFGLSSGCSMLLLPMDIPGDRSLWPAAGFAAAGVALTLLGSRIGR